MNSTAKKVENFREYLEKILKIDREIGNHHFESVISTILNEFNETFQDDPSHIKNISKLIKKYCNNTDRFICPICGSKMELKRNRKNILSFWGCSKYPDCRGARSRNGSITINEHLRNFLLEKQEEDRITKEEEGLGIDPRFKDLI